MSKTRNKKKDKNKKSLKDQNRYSTIIRYLLPVLMFYLVSVLYFSPQYQNKQLNTGDTVGSYARGYEVRDYKERTGQTTNWANSMFCGSPANMIYLGKEDNILSETVRLFQFLHSKPIGYFMSGMLCMYIAMLLLGGSPLLSCIIAILYAFATGHLVLYEAGHYNKIRVILYFPLVISGILSLLKNHKNLLAGLILAMGTSLSIYGTHYQMVYYLFLSLFVTIGSYLIIRQFNGYSLTKSLKQSGLIIGCVLLGVLTNVSNLDYAYNFNKESMRGQKSARVDSNVPENATNSALDWNYAMNWSSGFSDVYTLISPWVVGGSSAQRIGSKYGFYDILRRSGYPSENNKIRAPFYFGDNDSVAGPQYAGLVMMFLFILSLSFTPSKLKYAFLLGLIFTLGIAMGRNFETLNRLLFDYLPFFDKFRAPSANLNLLYPLLAIPAGLGLKEFFEKKNKPKRRKAIILTIGAIAIILLVVTMQCLNALSQVDYGNMQAEIQRILEKDRASMLYTSIKYSCVLTFFIGALFFAFTKDWIKSPLAILAGLLIIGFVDLYYVGQQYLNNSDFKSNRTFQENFNVRDVDQQIFTLEPKGRGYYRVLDLSIRTFSSALTSVHHNTIGGYDPVKLRSIQDILEEYIYNMNPKVLDMLNTKYIINDDEQLIPRSSALGNAWFVDKVRWVDDSNEELKGIAQLNIGDEAVAVRNDINRELQLPQMSQNRNIELIEYDSNFLKYKANTDAMSLAVFSEVFYGPDKGWTAKIDGEEVEIFKVNFLLRAINIKPGDHIVEFKFEPKSALIPKLISMITSLSVLLGILFISGKNFYGFLLNKRG